MRTYIKGGQWRNTEDEVLKGAVMKYGKNQWARVASLLNRKSAKQCKARWYEYLDPSIKKTSWTREEEEKLLHLAKLFPTQWRTIAPIVGRTAAQCLEQYEKLLDRATEREKDLIDEEDPRKFRAGEIDPTPEVRPSRPDTVDLDEDEKEMLSEALARLKNVKGKKAKRKARERQLEEAKRLASIQKRRELKAAGINTNLNRFRKRKIKATHIDYNKEIPYQRQPIIGSFDVSEETAQSVGLSLKWNDKTMEEMEGRDANAEAKQRKADQEKINRKRKTDLPGLIDQVKKATETEQLAKRQKISLPEPQLSDGKLEEIGKITAMESNELEQAQQHDSNVGSSSSGLANVSNKLLAPSVKQTPLRTPLRQTTADENLRLQAENLAYLTTQDTPLVGGSNDKMNEGYSDFSGIKPTPRIANRTPNILLEQQTNILGGTTPLLVQKPLAGTTPLLHDSSSSVVERNSEQGQPKNTLSSYPNRSQNVEEEVLDLRFDFKDLLPKPQQEKYHFKIAHPKSSTFSSAADALMSDVDAEEIDRQKFHLHMANTTQVLKRKLPIPRILNPVSVPSKNFVKNTSRKSKLDEASSKLVDIEMMTLMRNDNNNITLSNPLEGNRNEEIPLNLLEEARSMLSAEMQKDDRLSFVSQEKFDAIWIQCFEKFVKKNQIAFDDRLKELIKQQEENLSKLQSKANLILSGYQETAKKVFEDIQRKSVEILEMERNLELYKKMYEDESLAIPKRISELQELMLLEKGKHQKLQQEYDQIRKVASRQ